MEKGGKNPRSIFPTVFPPSEEDPIPPRPPRLRPQRALLALVAVGCAVLFGAGSPAHAGGGATTTLSNDVVHNLSLATLTGSVPATQAVTVGVFLSNPNQAAEDAYAKQLYNPS